MKENKIVAISDIHGELLKDLPKGDILTISGDICPVNGSHSPTNQMYWLKNHFFPWCDNLIRTKQFGDIVFVAGNHDFVFKKASVTTTGDFYMDLPRGVHYLQDTEININGVHIYGTPWTPTFGNWAWMVGEDMLKLFFEKIPPNMDILLSHGPAFGWNDTIMQYQETDHLGSQALRDAILRASPSWVFVGHIHSGNHIPTKIPSRHNAKLDEFETTHIVNVSILDENYVTSYKPFTTTITK